MENLRREIKSFKEGLGKMSPDQIFEKGEKIAFYREIENLLEDRDEINNYFTPEEIEKMRATENILHKSYTRYKNVYIFPISICYEDVTGVIKEQLEEEE